MRAVLSLVIVVRHDGVWYAERPHPTILSIEHPMRTLKLTIAYDGTRYAGWQAQRQTASRRHETADIRAGKPTVQETLERVLGRILREQVTVVGSGRTDAGVHALAQTAHVVIRSPIDLSRLHRSANALLPPEIAITRIEAAAPTFHARFQARSKHYRYRLFTGQVATPFIRPWVHHVRAPLTLSLMRGEAAALRGRHDFRAFARAGPVKDTRRAIRSIAVRRLGEEIRLDIEGDGFLHTMVRSIMGTLLDVGRGRLPPGTVRRMLRTGDRRLAGTTAPAKGLTLVSVNYGVRPQSGALELGV